MRYTKAQRAADFYRRLDQLGFSYSEANQLRRIEMTLHRWSEKECGDSNDYNSFAIERDEETGKPFMVIHPHNGNKSRKYPVPDAEKGALKRLAKIMERHPELWSYYQGDCRGCALYVGEKARLHPNTPLDCQYTNGFAVCI